ncbi:MAG: hypothetical protein ACTHLX_23660, partial [Candidatus Binatia bacterium]
MDRISQCSYHGGREADNRLAAATPFGRNSSKQLMILLEHAQDDGSAGNRRPCSTEPAEAKL